MREEERLEKLPILASVERVVSRARRVSFHPQHLEAAVSEWGHLLEARSGWQHPCHFFDGSEETVRWIFVLDVLNHCFWPDPGEPTWTVTYQGHPQSGYWGLAASLKKAKEAGVPITEAPFLAEISLEALDRIFSGEGRIPMLEERLANVREAGRILCSAWKGDILHLVEEARGSAVRTVRAITSAFASFRDEGHYRGEPVYFWKRAQIFASDLHAAFQGRKWGAFHDIAELTAFADYKLPQVLRALGLLSYDTDLAGRIDRREFLKPGSEEEVEIRAMTLRAVEALKGTFLKAGKPVTSADVDNWLWQLGQIEPFRHKPYHRCRTIYY